MAGSPEMGVNGCFLGLMRFERRQHRDFGITVGFNDLGNDHLIPIEPVGLFRFRFLVYRMLDQFLQGFKCLPGVNIGDPSCARVFPCFFTKIAWNFFCGFSDSLIRPIELAVELLLRKNEFRRVRVRN
jgi:hypothetical protein